MMRTVLILSSILALGLSDVLQLDNGDIVEVEFENTQPVQPSVITIPYPYQSNQKPQTHPVVVQPAPAPAPSTEGTTIIVPSTITTVTEVAEVAPAGYISTAIYSALCVVKSVLGFILTKAPALIAGTAVALAVCKFTCLCDSQVSVYDAQSQIVSIATPERISRAAEFVTEAVKKYNKMQEK